MEKKAEFIITKSLLPIDSYDLYGFVEILRQSIKLLSQNGRFINWITAIYLFLYSIFILLWIFSTNDSFYDWFANEIYLCTTSTAGAEFIGLIFHIKYYTRDIPKGIESVLFLAYFFIAIFTTTATIFTSAISHSGKVISDKEFLLMVTKSGTRATFTMFFVFFFSLGCITLFPPLMTAYNVTPGSKGISSVPHVLASILYLSLSVVWSLALVISVMEHSCYGVEALAKAGRIIVKGKWLHGFLLNFLTMLVSGIILKVFLNCVNLSGPIYPSEPVTQILMGLFLMCSIRVVTTFQFTAYTVLYFQCKESHGEKIELIECMEDEKLPITVFHVQKDKLKGMKMNHEEKIDEKEEDSTEVSAALVHEDIPQCKVILDEKTELNEKDGN